MDDNQLESSKESKGIERSQRPPHFGAMRGQIESQEGWEKPLNSEEADAFWEGRWSDDPKKGERSVDLDAIVAKLDDRKQRATYGAVAGILGGLARGLMNGRPKSEKYSWIVAKSGPKRGWPTGYTRAQIHPDCLWQIHNDAGAVIEDAEKLKEWLKS